MNFLITLLIKLVSTEVVKTAIGIGVNKLLESSKDGITKDIARAMIDGIVKSKQNPVREDLVEDALKLLK